MTSEKLKKKCNLQETFLKSLKKQIDTESGVDVCLWQLSYSYMKLVVCYKSQQYKELINQTLLDFN